MQKKLGTKLAVWFLQGSLTPGFSEADEQGGLQALKDSLVVMQAMGRRRTVSSCT